MVLPVFHEPRGRIRTQDRGRLQLADRLFESLDSPRNTDILRLESGSDGRWASTRSTFPSFPRAIIELFGRAVNATTGGKVIVVNTFARFVRIRRDGASTVPQPHLPGVTQIKGDV